MSLAGSWRKSSRSGINGNCLEWRKSSHSNHSNCTEVRSHGIHVEVRDSKDPDGPRLKFSSYDWATFLEGIKGERER
jgi:hypothetical protein